MSTYLKPPMKLSLLGLVTAISCISSVAQQTVFEQKVELQSSTMNKKESYPIIDDAGNNVSLLLIDYKYINAFKFDEYYKITNKIEVERPQSKYRKLLGHTIVDGGYDLLFSKGNKKDFCVKSISYDGSTKESIFELPRKDEVLIEAIPLDNRLFLLVIRENSSVLTLYEVLNGDLKELNVFAIFMEFGSFGRSNLYEALCEGAYGLKHQTIDNSIPNPLDLTSKQNKVYYYGNKIVLTLDDVTRHTKVIMIDIDDLTVSAKLL